MTTSYRGCRIGKVGAQVFGLEFNRKFNFFPDLVAISRHPPTNKGNSTTMDGHREPQISIPVEPEKQGSTRPFSL